MNKPHEHQWIYDHKSCCYVLKCEFAGCQRRTSVRKIKGTMPVIGQRVQLLIDGDTVKILE